jgi:hypothetical protein
MMSHPNTLPNEWVEAAIAHDPVIKQVLNHIEREKAESDMIPGQGTKWG